MKRVFSLQSFLSSSLLPCSPESLQFIVMNWGIDEKSQVKFWLDLCELISTALHYVKHFFFQIIKLELNLSVSSLPDKLEMRRGKCPRGQGQICQGQARFCYLVFVTSRSRANTLVAHRHLWEFWRSNLRTRQSCEFRWRAKQMFAVTLHQLIGIECLSIQIGIKLSWSVFLPPRCVASWLLHSYR